ncbi:MAG: hypothetical protein LUO96_04805 [Methanomicrobiales archaeon]|nr:hypothetical protein [Methanomicrobiales archaeon]
MTRERRSGQLPVDFLVGFTIFILSLIMVANFVPSLLVGLQRTSGIDYDAVAYRTGVVLVEDPGEPPGLLPVGSPPPPVDVEDPWELLPFNRKEFVNRFGLALTRDTPNILSINKIEQFFNSTYVYPGIGFFNDTDYRNKLLFSSYQYGYNVTLQNISPMKPSEYPAGITRMLGDPYPAGYGYIRRYVVIKQNSDAAVNLSTFWIPDAFIAYREDQVDLPSSCFGCCPRCPDPALPHQKFIVRLNQSVLYNKNIDTHLKIDLQREPLSIRITNFSSTLNNTALNTRFVYPIANSSYDWSLNGNYPGELVAPTSATLVAVMFGDPTFDPDVWTPFMQGVNLTVDDNHVDFPIPAGLGPEVTDKIELYVPNFEPYYLNDGRPLDVTFVFQNDLPHTHITGTFLYDYNRRNVTQPVLSTGMLEVAIW